MKQIFNFSFINLGCNKNLVDTQFLMWRIFDMGKNNPNYEVNYFTDPYDKAAKIVFLNTCGFISSWREEMLKVMNNLLKKWKKVYLLGCGLQYYENLIKKNSHPEWNEGYILHCVQNDNKINKISRNDFEKVTINNLIKWYNSQTFSDFRFTKWPRVYTNAEYKFEYLKIAEWCDNNCTFCIIPKIRWKQKSMPMEKIIDEVKNMIKAGIKEIILIAQDTSSYGTDIYGKWMLLELLKKMEKIKADFKFRLLYLYPDLLTLKWLKDLKWMRKFIPYFDIPLQHISSDVLKRMGRFYDKKKIYEILNFISKNFKSKFIRTNSIIWFPWESKKDFEELKRFIKEGWFDNIALFEYHDEKFSTASKLSNKIPAKTIRKRFNEVKKLVDELFERKQKLRKWEKETWFIMDFETSNYKPSTINYKLFVRPWLNAPEIDSYDKIDMKKIIDKKNIPNRQKNQWNIIFLDDWVIPTTWETGSINEVKWLQISKAVRYNLKIGDQIEYIV